MFHRTLFDPQLFPRFSTPFPTLALGVYSPPPLLHSSMSRSIAPLQGGFCFGRLGEQSPFLQVMSPSLSSKSPWVRLKSATHQTWDDGLHYCFFQEREEGAIPFGVSFFSDTLKHGQIRVR